MDCTVPSALQREPHTVQRTVAFADIVGSTALAEQHELEAFRCVRRVLAMLRRNARVLGGRVVDEAGDGALAVFPCACEAVLWAAWCHEAAMRCGRRKPGYGVLRLRIGIHVGPVLIYGVRVFGRNVVVACRLQQAAHPGETLISASVHDLLPNRAIACAFRVGEIQLKGITGRVDAYRIMATIRVLASGLPPGKWSSLRYGFEPDGGHEHAQEETHGRGDHCRAAAGGRADFLGPAGGGGGPSDRA